MIGNRTYVNFSSYNYAGLNGDPRITAAAKAAIDRYGTSVSASRMVSGERPVHRELEQALARVHGAEDSVVLVGGHSTNVTVIGHLLGRNDVIVHDAFIHNSIVQGAILSGARRVPFRHLDPEAADKVLAEARPRLGPSRRDRPGRGRYLDGDAQQEPRLLRRLHRRPQRPDRLPEAHGGGFRLFGRHGALGGGGGTGRA